MRTPLTPILSQHVKKPWQTSTVISKIFKENQRCNLFTFDFYESFVAGLVSVKGKALFVLQGTTKFQDSEQRE